jgi:hypothetical protein
LDGKCHNETRREDEYRDNVLKTRGFRVLHFTNDQVFDRMDWILQTIADELEIDWEKDYRDCAAWVKYPRRLYALLAEIQQYREQQEREGNASVD